MKISFPFKACLGLFLMCPDMPVRADGGFPAGLSGEAAYISDYWHLASGGERPGAGAYLTNIDLTLSADLGELAGLRGVRAFAYGLHNNGAGFSDGIVGDAQVISNIEAPVAALRLYEAWVETDVLAGRGTLRAGLYDVNSEFDVLESAGLFLGSGHGIGTDIGQSGEHGPSIFPITALGIRAAARLGENWRLRLAVLDGVPGDPAAPGRTAVKLGGGDGAFVIGELAYHAGEMTLLAGAWGYTAAFDRFDGGRGGGNRGYYLRGERWLHREAGDHTQGLRGFVRLGTAAAAYNDFGGFLGLGLNYRGLFAGRPGDESGIALAWAETSSVRQGGDNVAGREIALEFTHRAAIMEGVTLQPDLQYILNPGADPTRQNALAIGLRLEIAWR